MEQNHFGTDKVNSNTISKFGVAIGLEIEAKDSPIYGPFQFHPCLQLEGYSETRTATECNLLVRLGYVYHVRDLPHTHTHTHTQALSPLSGV